MKRILFSLLILCFICEIAWAIPPSSGSSGVNTTYDANSDSIIDADKVATLNQSTTGSSGSVKSPATTGVSTFTGPGAGTTRAKTVRDANDTLLELGGTYTPSGTWDWSSATVTWPTNLNALNGLTFVDASILQLTGAGAAAVLTSGGNDYFLKSTSDNGAIEFATPANALSAIGAQASDSDLTTIAGLSPVQSKILIGDATPAWSVSGFTLAAPGAAGAILYSDGTNWTRATSLSLSTVNLPSSDADPSTTAGQIRHDSSSTESSANGVLKFFNGTNVGTVVHTGTDYTLITKYQYLPIRYAEDDVSVAAPAAAAEIGTTSLIARSFAEDADNGVIFFLQVPSDFVSGIKYRVYYATDTNAGADETAAFALSGCSVGNLDALACSEGTAVVVTDELTADYDTSELIVTDWSAAVTVTNIAAGEMASLLLIRDVSEDDMVGHALVAGIEIKYVGKINPFSDY